MQYLLTEEEYKALQDKAKLGEKAPDKKALQELCTMVADNVPIQEGFGKGHIWGCILTKDDEGYCDNCPAQKVCPFEYKNWSK